MKKWQVPPFNNTDKAPTYGRALTLLKCESRSPLDVELRQINYLNNVIECDHGKLKRIEVMRAIRKGQASTFYYIDSLCEVHLVSRIFEM